MLPSRLPKVVGDDEDLARFLTQSNHFNTKGVKHQAFLPAPKARETSVYRHGAEPSAALWKIGDECVAGSRTIHGAAIVKASAVRTAELDVVSDEPPPLHAAIRGWPRHKNDLALQKSEQKELAMRVASKAALWRR